MRQPDLPAGCHAKILQVNKRRVRLSASTDSLLREKSDSQVTVSTSFPGSGHDAGSPRNCYRGPRRERFRLGAGRRTQIGTRCPTTVLLTLAMGGQPGTCPANSPRRPGVPLGTGPFLRILWERAGITQRKLSIEAGGTEHVPGNKTMGRLGYITRRQGRLSGQEPGCSLLCRKPL
jgi:hypothetical protein